MNSLVHIVDDDAQVRAATAYLLESHGFEIAAHAGGAELLADPRLDRGCILLDIRMPGMSGHEVQEELVRRGIPLPVVVMSAHGDLPAAVRAMKLGAVDFIQKPPSEEELVGAINRALEAFRRGADRRVAAQAAQAKLKGLSRRERQILQGLLAGSSNKAIARQLDLSPRTVEMHRANMMAELGVATLSEALRIAIDAELPPLNAGSEPQIPAYLTERPVVSIDNPAVLGGPLQLVLESSGEGTWDWNMVTGEVLLSQRRVEQLGLAPGTPRDRIERLQSLVHPEDQSAFRRALDDHLEGRSESYGCAYRIRTPDGQWRWQEARGRIVERDPATNQPLRMLGTVRDITEQRLGEEKSRQTMELLELAQRGAGAGVWDIDVATRQLHLCPRTRELLGLEADGPQDLALEDWTAQIHPDDQPAMFATIQHAIDTGEPCSVEFRVRSEGPPRWVLALGKVIHDGEGRPYRLIGLSQDISARKAAVRESNRAQSELIHFSGVSAVGTMVSTLTHELSQPLTAIAHFARGIVRRLEASGALEDQALREALAGAERSAQLAAEIVGRVGRQVPSRIPERQAASLSALVRESCALALIDADAQGIRHSLDLDPQADRVSVDPVQIQQILLNLLRNAGDSLMEVPVPQRRLKLGTRRIAPDEVAVEVADSGTGIADEVIGSLFEPFVTSKPEGTGIGLSICRTLVEGHGGHIEASNRPEGGALFRFTLKA